MGDTHAAAVKRLVERIAPGVAVNRRTVPVTVNGRVVDRVYLVPEWLRTMTGADPATVQRCGLPLPGNDLPAARWSDAQIAEWLVWRWRSTLGDRADVIAAAASATFDVVLDAARQVRPLVTRRAG